MNPKRSDPGSVEANSASTAPHVTAVCGSLREESYTRLSLSHVLDAAEMHGASTDLLDVRHYDLRVHDPVADQQGDAAELAKCVRTADAIVLGTPVYHGSYSSPLKAVLDHCGFREFEGSTVGLLAVSGGTDSYTSALHHMRIVARTLRAWVVPHQVGIGAPEEQFDQDGAVADENLATRMATLGRIAVEFTPIEPHPRDARTETALGANE